MLEDFWDPNTWDTTEPEYYLLLTPRLEPRVRLDYIDYQWAIQWLWDVRYAQRYQKRGHKSKKRIGYAARSSARHVNGPGRGVRTNYLAYRENFTIYLHIEIMKRTGIPPPTPKHVLVDHIDNDTFNCRRENLQWATHAMNRANRADTKTHPFSRGRLVD